MNPLSTEGLSALLAGAGIALPPGAVEKLVRHAEEMLRWNRSIRMTAITAPLEVAVKHILDSLMLLSFAPFPGKTMDFGSGAGFPGIPLAIALPDASLVLLEASAKKCAFLSHACAMLSPLHAEVLRGRLDPRKVLPIGRFEQIVTRATLAPRDAARLLLPYLSPGGRLLLMTGRESLQKGFDERRFEPRGGAGEQGEGRPGMAAEAAEAAPGARTGGPSARGPGEGPCAEPELPAGARYGRRMPFSLPYGMGGREIREVLAAS